MKDAQSSIVYHALNNPVTGKSYRQGIIKSIDRGYYKEGDNLDLSKLDKEVQAYQRSFLVHWNRLRDMPEEKELFKNLKTEDKIKEQEEHLKRQFVDWILGTDSDLRTKGFIYGEDTRGKITSRFSRLKFWNKKQ